jgi:hypothetical protein
MKKLLIALGILMAVFSTQAVAAITDGKLFNPNQLSPPVISTTLDNRETFSIPLTEYLEISLLAEVAGQKNVNSFGIYNPSNLNEKLQVFSGADSPPVTAKIVLPEELSKVGISPTNFGFYLATNSANQGTFYSQNALNAGNISDHMLSFKLDVKGSPIQYSYILGWEDLKNNGDRDYNDMVVSTKVTPIPGAVWLFGSGIAGLVGLSRRKVDSSKLAA